MEAFLELLSSGTVRVDRLLQRQYGIEEGERAYAEIQESGAYTAILKYDPARFVPRTASPPANKPQGSSESLRIGCIGAGSFARSVIFPQLRALRCAELDAVSSASGVSAFAAQKAFHFRRALPPAEMLASPDIDAIFVLSRHDTHAEYVVSAMSQRKPVFVEKPLAVCPDELEDICKTYQREQSQGRSPFVMVGFNRRFAPASEAIREFFAARRERMVVHVRVNAGFLPREHWTQNGHSGGRIIGEACHFLDWVRWIVGDNIVSIYAKAIPDGARYNADNVVIVVSFADGSVGNILYVANGDKSLPKEYYEVFCEGSVARLDDFRSLELFRNGKRRHIRYEHDKGHKKELALTVHAMREGLVSPIPFDELVEVTESTFAVGESLRCGLPSDLRALNLREQCRVI